MGCTSSQDTKPPTETPTKPPTPGPKRNRMHEERLEGENSDLENPGDEFKIDLNNPDLVLDGSPKEKPKPPDIKKEAKKKEIKLEPLPADLEKKVTDPKNAHAGFEKIKPEPKVAEVLPPIVLEETKEKRMKNPEKPDPKQKLKSLGYNFEAFAVEEKEETVQPKSSAVGRLFVPYVDTEEMYRKQPTSDVEFGSKKDADAMAGTFLLLLWLLT